MKKIKTVIILLMIIILSGCVKTDDMENISIYTSIYPVKFGVEFLYKEHSTIQSIYPSGIDIYQYNLNDKQLTDFSKGDLFIFNGLGQEKNYAVTMLNKNKKLKIIDISSGLEASKHLEELWLDPYDYLMMVQNIQKGLNEYISNPYLKEEINDKYDEFKILISEIDAEIKTAVEYAPSKTLVVGSDMFKYLEKYNCEIISLEDNEGLTDKTISEVKKMIDNEKIKYIYLPKGSEPNKIVADILTNYEGIDAVYIDTLTTFKEDDNEDNEDFISITYKNIELFKKELYK